MQTLRQGAFAMGLTFWQIPVILVLLIPAGFKFISDSSSPITYAVEALWLMGMPIIVIALAGAYKSRNVRLSDFSGHIDEMVVFQIASIARWDVVNALERVINSIVSSAPRNLRNWFINLVIEENSEARSYLEKKYGGSNRIRITVVPREYRTKKGALAKSRANQYAIENLRAQGLISKSTWIYHLDDDTSIGPESVAAVAEHIMRYGDKYYLAQGILSFPHFLTRNFITKYADSMRPTDDLTRFYFFTNVIKMPLIGLHGENMLVRSDVEESVGWDNGNRAIADDSFFALNFAYLYPGRSAFMPAITYGSSPTTIRDMLKQRKRWFLNVSNLSFYGGIPIKYRAFMIYSIIFWIGMVVQNVVPILMVLHFLGVIRMAVINPEVLFLWAFTLSFWIWFYISGLRINREVSGIYRESLIDYAILVFLYIFVISPLEIIGGLLGFISFLKNERSFEVISKPI
ncbi:zeste-white 4 related membrane protein [Thermoplasma acidophilum]|uniref:Zeste-white 4 related membrane protein n=1 Tax=Thermoplasma acidophilum (strain ATCC 25905 / DSM 1728 / JCM 9062 / NBRC 15155 / AMRC-C165) TaxID=273075 RepID=Q9HLL4_THEAC|nr:glycosyltransferase family 2 protein [Thermoplasma acidophilum]CAC11359.1 zeste-white 4 related membrane protein [Thermoplasma acidophilum]